MANLQTIKSNLKQLGAGWFVLSRPEIRQLSDVLESHEEIDGFAFGSCQGRMSFLFATDRRLLYLDRQLFKTRVDSIPFMNMTNVEHTKGFMMGQVTVHTTSNDYEMTRVHKDQLDRFCRVAQQRMHEANQSRVR